MASWGRHGWPRKNEGFRLYQERDGAYIMIVADYERGQYEGVGNAMTDPMKPSLAGISVTNDYIYAKCRKRVQWSELPEIWQRAFRHWLPEGHKPEEIRGFWLVGKMPKPAEQATA